MRQQKWPRQWWNQRVQIQHRCYLFSHPNAALPAAPEGGTHTCSPPQGGWLRHECGSPWHSTYCRLRGTGLALDCGPGKVTSNGWALITDMLVHLSESFKPWGRRRFPNLPRGSKAHPGQLKLGQSSPRKSHPGPGLGGPGHGSLVCWLPMTRLPLSRAGATCRLSCRLRAGAGDWLATPQFIQHLRCCQLRTSAIWVLPCCQLVFCFFVFYHFIHF